MIWSQRLFTSDNVYSLSRAPFKPTYQVEDDDEDLTDQHGPGVEARIPHLGENTIMDARPCEREDNAGYRRGRLGKRGVTEEDNLSSPRSFLRSCRRSLLHANSDDEDDD